MDSNQFLKEEEELKQAILSSDLYKELTRLSNVIDSNSKIASLAKERNGLYSKAADEDDESRKREYLKEAKEKDDSILSFPEVQQYNRLYRHLKTILRRLTDSLSEVLK